MTKHYLNAQYPNPRGGPSISGRDLWVSATVKRGTRPVPPTVIWHAERAAAGGDVHFVEDLFIEDPVFDVPAGQEAGDTRWVKVTVPDVTGLTWRFRVRRQKVGKPEKVIRVKGEVETWKRYFLDVNADDDALYDLYRQALPHIKTAFARACIEVVENRVQVNDVYKRGKSADKASKDGRLLGERFSVDMHHPERDEVFPNITMTLANGATNCGAFATVEGNDLVLRLARGAWDPTPTRSLKITANAATLVNWAYHGTLDAHNNRDLANATLNLVCQRISDTELRLHLDHVRMANTYNTVTRAWDTPRPQSVQAAVLAGPVEIKISLNYAIVGATGGQQVGSSTRFDTYIDANPLKLASVLAHEFAHACRLVKQHFIRKHAAAQLDYDTATPPRVALAAQVLNATFYDASFGGSGTHCNLGAAQAPSCITNSGQTYNPNPGQVMCLMYHASVVAPDGTLRTNGVRFCAACERQLRGL